MKKSLPKPMYSSSSSNPSSHRLFEQPLLLVLSLVFFFYLTSLSCSSSTTTHHQNLDGEEISYTDHCSSIVPESTPITNSGSNSFSFPRSLTGYFYTTNNGILSQNPLQNSTDYMKSLSFRTRKVQMTRTDDVFKVEATMRLKSSYMYYYNDYDNSTNTNVEEDQSTTTRFEIRIGILRLRLNGFWYESSGKLCMVGLGTTHSKQTGDVINLAVVLKLNYFKNSSIVTSLGTGSLESLNSVDDSSYFEKVLIFTFADKRNYHYSLVLKEFGNGGFNGSDDVTKSLPVISSQPSRSLCSVLLSPSKNKLELKYSSNCESAKNCTPFGENTGHLPSLMALSVIQCTDSNQRVRVLVKFLNNSYDAYYQSFNPNTTLIGEGLWDGKKNRLCVVACRILNISGSLDDTHTGDCSIRLTLRFPAVWSIRDSRDIVGEIWSSKPVNDSEYFDRIVYKSSHNHGADFRGQKYKYTLIDRAKKFCPKKKASRNMMERYPNVHSYDMIFDMSVSNSKEGGFSWGYSIPLFVGNEFYDRFQYEIAMASSSSSSTVVHSKVGLNSSLLVPINISYKMSFGDIWRYNMSSNPDRRVEVSSEGIYDPKTGDLCMIGCKNIDSKNQVREKDSLDCEILIKYQFPSLNSMNNEGYTKGTIESTREKHDPLYFDLLRWRTLDPPTVVEAY